MRIGIVTQWYPPEPGPATLPAELARSLASRGHEVRVLTGLPNYPEGHLYDGYRINRSVDAVVDGILVHRTPLIPSHSRSAIGRLINYGSFGASSAVLAAEFLYPCDAVWASNSPPTIGPLLRRLRRRNIAIVVHVLDLWPDNVESANLISGSILRRLTNATAARLAHDVYSQADLILGISEGVPALLQSRGVLPSAVAFSPLWANESLFYPRPANPLTRHQLGTRDDAVVILYAGAIGSTQNIGALVDASAKLDVRLHNAVEFWIAGDGVDLPNIEAKIAGRPSRSPTVRLLGRRPMLEMPTLISASDICYVGLQNDHHARFTMPSKVQTTLAMGKPLLADVPGDVHELVLRLGIGFTSGGTGSDALAEEITKAVGLGREGLASIGRAARYAYESEFSLSTATDRIERALSISRNANAPRGGTIIREARPADVRRIARLHLETFHGFFLSDLGAGFLRVLYRDLAAKSEGILLVAESGRGIDGFVAGVVDEVRYFAALRRRRFFQFLGAAAMAALRHPKDVVPRLWRARNRSTAVEASDSPATLLSIGVSPRKQGGGVGSSLVREFESTLRMRQIQTYSLNTDAVNNSRTIDFYTAQGLCAIRHFTTSEGRRMIEFRGSVDLGDGMRT